MRIVIIGSGYVGLVTGACLSSLGHRVVCVDTDTAKIETLKRGEIPIYEPGLEELVADNAAAGRLAFATGLETEVASAEVIFICVGTPPRAGDGHADLSSVFAVARSIGRALRQPAVIVSKSTVPVGTSDEIERLIAEAKPSARFEVVSNPEFLREGSAIADFMNPDRIVIGAASATARQVMIRIYDGLVRRGARLHLTARRSAELIKYAANAFLAVKITFINEVADLCEAAGSDVEEVAVGVGLDSRIGEKFLKAGPGFGGSCFPKDTLALVKTAQDMGCPLRLIETTIGINDQRKRGMARKIIAACGGDVRGKSIAILGLAFKAETDDVRGAPSLDIIRALQDKGAVVRAFDPAAMDNAAAHLSDVGFATSVEDVLTGADAAVIVTDWKMFGALDLRRLARVMRQPVLVDLRNLYDSRDAMRQGFLYSSVGRKVDAERVTLPAHGRLRFPEDEADAAFGRVAALG